MNPQDGDPVQANAAHAEYLAEVRRLVDEQVAALFQTVSAAASRIGATTMSGQAAQAQNNRTMTLTAGGRAATLTVEAVTDLPEGSDRAQEFPSGQARCTVNAGSTTDVWDLHRVGDVDNLRYGWVDGNTLAPLDEAEIANRLQTALGGAAGDATTYVSTSAAGYEAGIGATGAAAQDVFTAEAGGRIIPVDGDPRTIEGETP